MLLDDILGKGKLVKMIIKAVEADSPAGGGGIGAAIGAALGIGAGNAGNSYTVQVNPDSFSLSTGVCYQASKALGAETSPLFYIGTVPRKFEFEFLFDGTGVIPASSGPLDNVPIAGAIADLIAGEKFEVMDEIKKFSDIIYKLDGKIHSPRAVQITWGKLNFTGKVTNVDYTFKLFKPDGTPLRVVAKAKFTEHIEKKIGDAKANLSSPDLTHIRTVMAGDTLPLMCQRIYGDPAYYVEVAKINKLSNFRKLTPGQKLIFPPLDKTVK